MGRHKKIAVEDDVTNVEYARIANHKVLPLETEFNREDLNLLKNKLNELIEATK